MSASQVEREFNRQSYAERQAAARSWESFIAFAAQVIQISFEIISALKRLYEILRKRY